MTLRRTIQISCTLIIIPGLLYAGFWWFLARHIEQSFEQWVNSRRANGWNVEWSAKRVAGFPGAVYLRVHDPRIRLPGGLSWQTDQIGVKISPRHSDQIRMTISGTHQIGWRGQGWQIGLADGRLITNINEQGGLDSATVQAHRLSVIEGDNLPLTIKELALIWNPREEAPALPTPAVIDFSATAHDVVWSGPLPLPLDGRIGLIAVDGQVRGGVPDLESRDEILSWKSKGGGIDVKHAAIEWSPMALSASGNLDLDEEGQVAAQFMGRLRGFDPLLDRLQAGGAVSADMAMAAKAMFALMSRPDPQGRPAISVPLTLQQGNLLLGNTPIARLPAVTW